MCSSDLRLPTEPVALLGSTAAQRIDALVHDLVEESARTEDIRQTADYAEALLALRAFMFDEVPDPVDWFQNTPVVDNVDIGGAACVTSPGDHVVLRAEMDLHLIVTSCSMDLGPRFINGPRCTPIRVDVADSADFA